MEPSATNRLLFEKETTISAYFLPLTYLPPSPTIVILVLEKVLIKESHVAAVTFC